MAQEINGTVIIPAGANVWDHELRTAKVFARFGFTVTFIVSDKGHRIKSADILINDVTYEIKSPKSSRLSAVERNLKRASSQSANIVFDSRRMKGLPDRSIENELKKQFLLAKGIKRLLFVNRKGTFIDIGKLI